MAPKCLHLTEHERTVRTFMFELCVTGSGREVCHWLRRCKLHQSHHSCRTGRASGTRMFALDGTRAHCQDLMFELCVTGSSRVVCHWLRQCELRHHLCRTGRASGTRMFALDGIRAHCQDLMFELCVTGSSRVVCHWLRQCKLRHHLCRTAGASDTRSFAFDETLATADLNSDPRPGSAPPQSARLPKGGTRGQRNLRSSGLRSPGRYECS